MAIVRLKRPVNMGQTLQNVRFFIFVLTPSKEKGTKNALETGRTFATLFADINFRHELLEAKNETEFKKILLAHAQNVADQQSNPLKCLNNSTEDLNTEGSRCRLMQGLIDDIKRRSSFYLSDYIDGFVGRHTVHKTLSTTFFLYFACLLPTIAFGVLNDNSTRGQIDVRKSIIGQTIGGLVFALLGGQPLVIIMTTAPLSLYIKVISSICESYQLDFSAMYACVGLWNAFFLIFFSIFDVNRIMKWSTRSIEEIFALFITIAFTVDAVKDTYKNFEQNYMSPACSTNSVMYALDVTYSSIENSTLHNSTLGVTCKHETSLLFLLLCCGTVWLAMLLYNFNKTPYLQARNREILADYALPVAVLTMSFLGSFVFKDVATDPFPYTGDSQLTRAPIENLPWSAVIGGLDLGFSLSLLFFMDQNISAAMVNNPSNKLKKGPAYHLDLLVVGVINCFLSMFGFPWMHGILPHSPLHARSLADVEERVEHGHVYERIVNIRETRVTGIASHVLIGASVFLLPYPMAYIPTAVLDGLFLYMAISALNGNQMFERITLFFMEQSSYPPNHYIRRCAQKKVHTFTACQLLQLGVMCFFGYAPWHYVRMIFPVIIFMMLPIRQKLIPLLIEEKYLDALDGEN